MGGRDIRPPNFTMEKEMTYQEFKRQYSIALDPQQEKAVQTVEGAVLLLAVPGSGKTTVLVERLGYMVLGCGILPEQILTMTYTVAATRDMKSRFVRRFGEALGQRLEFRTINGVSARIISSYERMYQRKAFTLVTEESELNGLVGEIYRKITGEYPGEGDIKAVRTAFTYVKNQMLSGEEIEQLDEEIKHFSVMYREYNQILRQRGCMDYDDQMVYAYQILRKYPAVLSAFHKRYRYLCVDEAQDTSRIQHHIIRMLAQEHQNLFMVGDEDQSIYGFRAAYPQALLEFEKIYPQSKILLMEQNYRSISKIVQTADKFIQKNQNRHPKHMVAHRCGESGVVRKMFRDRREQYDYLVKLARNCERETAVLYRDNDCALPVIDLLERKGIPYRCRQMDGGFFSHKVIRDLSDILRLSEDPCDRNPFLRVYYKFGAGIKKEWAEEAVGCMDGTPLFFQLQAQEEMSDWSKERCGSIQKHLEMMKSESADRAVHRILTWMGYGDYLEKRGIDPGRAYILQALGEQEPSPRRLLERLEELRGLLEEYQEDKNCPFVLSTIHSSKGLEYERVILMDVIDGVLPKNTGDGDTDEERRLFYVGMTRAKDELTVFTFQNPRFRSAFADEVFHVPKQTKPSGRWKGETPTKPMGRPEDFATGARVRHRSFGVGTVMSQSGDLLEVVFADRSQRKLSLSAALRAGVLECLEKSRL